MPSERYTNENLSDVSPIEPLSSLRAHPEWYFKSGGFERETVISLLVREALLSRHITRAWALKDGAWTAVKADGDWLGGDLRAFSTPTPFPEEGINAIRVEVLLAAFCDTVATAANGRRDDIESARPREIPGPMRAALEDTGEGRVIVFRSPLDRQATSTVIPLTNDIFPKVRMDKALRRLEESAHA
jgi:hypothetical protein